MAGPNRPFVRIDGPVDNFLMRNRSRIDSGFIIRNGEKKTPDAEWVSVETEFARDLVVAALRSLAREGSLMFALRFVTGEDNPDILSFAKVDELMREYLEAHAFELVMADVPGFDAAGIAKELGIEQRIITDSIRRLAADYGNWIALIGFETDNPVPIRDYGKVPSAPVAAGK